MVQLNVKPEFKHPDADPFSTTFLPPLAQDVWRCVALLFVTSILIYGIVSGDNYFIYYTNHSVIFVVAYFWTLILMQVYGQKFFEVPFFRGSSKSVNKQVPSLGRGFDVSKSKWIHSLSIFMPLPLVNSFVAMVGYWVLIYGPGEFYSAYSVLAHGITALVMTIELMQMKMKMYFVSLFLVLGFALLYMAWMFIYNARFAKWIYGSAAHNFF
jgi:hypothetical protein